MGPQLPGILESSLAAAQEADPNVETRMLLTDIVLIWRGIDAGSLRLAVDHEKFSLRF